MRRKDEPRPSFRRKPEPKNTELAMFPQAVFLDPGFRRDDEGVNA